MNTAASSTQPTTGWFKSSFSNPSQACVEVRFSDRAVYVRDSKDCGEGPVISVSGNAWSTLLAEVAGRLPVGTSGTIRIVHRTDGGADLQSLPARSLTLSYTAAEWDAFVAGVRAGEFDLPHSAQPAA
ncbi:DUF397 domain-containing protein [Saccharopolyspora sp. ASAGF58]|uniref:DUF397 domain-containing protein n=1 Tax=Saccharopolyspora sp. ASAGF58 TaxID=2719023 RepID=UPI00143FB906|nr:DUF397 domain-containing protein [Saccharopolyspora sp. ASAGF58]QIZ38416.1 DUF397 domain-containing protein [Saccharopolyspora sp. ASAGF58]